MPHAQASIDSLGEADRLQELAVRFHREAHAFASAIIQPARVHQIAVDECVEEFVINDIVDVMIDIVIPPASGDLALVAIMLAAF